jgi:hypothetical protein
VSGEIRTVLWNSANVLDQKGSVIATVAQGQDITDRGVEYYVEAIDGSNKGYMPAEGAGQPLSLDLIFQIGYDLVRAREATARKFRTLTCSWINGLPVTSWRRC